MINKIIISDTSCLIALDRIKKLDVLQKTFSTVITTPEVRDEFLQPLPSWILIRPVKDQKRKESFGTIVDKGEASAIALALETEGSILVIDEKKGRKLAEKLHIEIIGTLKILLLAKEKGVISSIKPIILELEKAQFRFSKSVVQKLLLLAGEQ